MGRGWLVVLFFCFGMLAGGAVGAAEPTFPALTGRVVDQARLLDENTRSSIDRKLADVEMKTGRQFVVVTLASLQGYEIEDYGYRLGRKWGIGDKTTNSGVLLIVAPNEHRVRIEVGYGVEGMLTDAVSRLIIENAILPRFRVNDFSGGIVRGVDDIIQVLSGDAEDFKRRATERNDAPAGADDWAQLVWIAAILGLWLFFMLRSRRNRGGGLPWIIPIGGRWPSGVGGSGWGGFDRGARGGFSGGGGSFGGGGASGRW